MTREDLSEKAYEVAKIIVGQFKDLREEITCEDGEAYCTAYEAGFIAGSVNLFISQNLIDYSIEDCDFFSDMVARLVSQPFWRVFE